MNRGFSPFSSYERYLPSLSVRSVRTYLLVPLSSTKLTVRSPSTTLTMFLPPVLSFIMFATALRLSDCTLLMQASAISFSPVATAKSQRALKVSSSNCLVSTRGAMMDDTLLPMSASVDVLRLSMASMSSCCIRPASTSSWRRLRIYDSALLYLLTLET